MIAAELGLAVVEKSRTISDKSGYGAVVPAYGRAAGDIAEEIDMTENHREGVGKKVSGSIKEAVGKITGDTKVEAEGKAEKTSERVQSGTTHSRDHARSVAKK